MAIQTESQLTNELDGDLLQDKHHNQQTRDIRKLATQIEKFSTPFVFSNNSEAKSKGLEIGSVYRTEDGTLKIVY